MGMRTKRFDELLTDVRNSDLPLGGTVELVGGNHNAPDPPPKSSVYAYCLRKAFDSAGYRATLHVDGSPDSDFYCMSRARTLVTAPGGFSRLVGQLVLHRGGRLGQPVP